MVNFICGALDAVVEAWFCGADFCSHGQGSAMGTNRGSCKRMRDLLLDHLFSSDCSGRTSNSGKPLKPPTSVGYSTQHFRQSLTVLYTHSFTRSLVNAKFSV